MCDEWHEGLPLAYGPDAPIYWYGLSPEERTTRFELNEDTAILDGEHYFIRGRIEIPIREFDDPFVWVAWSSLSRDDFAKLSEVWLSPDRERLPPMFGWLSSELEGYPSTVNLKVNVHQRAPGARPVIEVEPTDHPLAVEQRAGMSWERVQELAELILHGTGGGAV